MPDPEPDRTLQSILVEGERLLQRLGIDSPSLSVQLLCASVLGTDRLGVLIDRGRMLSSEQWAAAWELVLRRAQGEPVSYILGIKEFYGQEFEVAPPVLVPRPETELLVELADALMPHDLPFTFADLGTGSGVLAVMMALLRSRSRGAAVDKSIGALRIARANAMRHGVGTRITFLLGDFCSPLKTEGFDLLLANPPYLSEEEHGRVSKEVSGYEPRQALCSGPSGMECIEAIVRQAHRVLRVGGILAMEIGSGQGSATKSILEAKGCYEQITSHQDLAGRDRVVTARRSNGKKDTGVVVRSHSTIQGQINNLEK
jgi:release factor glutamine methyltransferase